MSQAIPYLDLPAQLRPLRKELDAVIAKTLDNCSFCLGPDVVQFEKDFAKFCGAKHAGRLQHRHVSASYCDDAFECRAGR